MRTTVDLFREEFPTGLYHLRFVRQVVACKKLKTIENYKTVRPKKMGTVEVVVYEISSNHKVLTENFDLLKRCSRPHA